MRSLFILLLAVFVVGSVQAGDPAVENIEVKVIKEDGAEPKVTVIKNGVPVDLSEADLAKNTWVASDRPFLGVMLEGDSQEGVKIISVVPDSPAAAGGIQAGDVIVGFDGADIKKGSDLTEAINARKIGDRVNVRVLREGSNQSLEVELGESQGVNVFKLRGDGEHPFIALEGLKGLKGLESLEDLEGLEKLRSLEGLHKLEGLGDGLKFFHCEGEDCEDGDHPNIFRMRIGGKPLLGVHLTETTPDLREHLGGDRERGVLVSKVMEDMPAEIAGIQVGDLIVAVDGVDISNGMDLGRSIQSNAGKTVRIEFVRDGRLSSIDVALPEREAKTWTTPEA